MLWLSNLYILYRTNICIHNSILIMNSVLFIQTNTFQCILASDGFSSYVIFMYANNGIQWTTGDASGGTNGLGGIPAQAGFDAGNLKDFTLIEGSFTSDIINIDNKSNVDWPGLFVFQVNNVMEQAGKSKGYL